MKEKHKFPVSGIKEETGPTNTEMIERNNISKFIPISSSA